MNSRCKRPPVILQAELTNPSSDSLSLRSLLLFVTYFKSRECVLETSRDFADIYWNWIKHLFLTDFIQEIVFEEAREKGYKIVAPPSHGLVIIDRISPETLPSVLAELHF